MSDLPRSVAALSLDEAFVRQLPGETSGDRRPRALEGVLWSRIEPEVMPAPRVLAVSREVMDLLGLPMTDADDPAFAAWLAGNLLLPGSTPHATNYGGHQFGSWAGQLGDGRALTLTEVCTPGGGHQTLQLKGSGRTPYSRHADGRSVLRSSVREFIASEAMHHLGVPTTRALGIVATGEAVVRDILYDGRPAPEPGAIVCRVAPSFVRIGHFELPASRGDTALLRSLLDYCIARDFAHLQDRPEAYAAWFEEVCRSTAVVVAHWMRIGWVHGVLNTDNMSVLGLTIDYGPYGWVEDFDPDFTPNTTDAQQRRYRFGWQPRIALWNLQQLAMAVSPLFAGDPAPLEAGLNAFAQTYAKQERDNAGAKLGLDAAAPDTLMRMRKLQTWMREAHVDWTLFFRALCGVDLSKPALDVMREDFAHVFYDDATRDAHAAAFAQWWAGYAAQVHEEARAPHERRAAMQAVNPEFVPRNWIVQQCIEAVQAGDAEALPQLLEFCRRPYDTRPERAHLCVRRPAWATHVPGCSQLSCSS